MGYWQNRRERLEKEKRLNSLTPEELNALGEHEKQSYLDIAIKLVRKRGQVNAYKDFPNPDVEIVYENEDDEEREEEDESNI